MAAGGFAVFAATLAPFALVLRQAPGALKPLWIERSRLWSFVDDGKYALEELAKQAGLDALARAASLQTHIAFTMMLALCAYFFWRGFANRRQRGWPHYFWIIGVIIVFFAPAYAPRLTPQRLDLLATIFIGLKNAGAHHGARAELFPQVFLVWRAVCAAAAGCFLALCCHDAGYRLQEALLEFGVQAETSNSKAGSRFAFDRSEARPFAGAADFEERAGGADTRRSGGPDFGAADSDRSGFGHRGQLRDPDSPRARAYATLGVPIGASKAEIERAYREKMKRAHPDRGGAVELAAALNQARDELLPHG